MSKPTAVLISDVHYNIHTLEVADKAMRMAIKKANELEVPLVVAGDLHDTKANLRGECIKAMIDTFETYNRNEEDEFSRQEIYVLVGNHDKINEKSEGNSLEFLSNRCVLVSNLHFNNKIRAFSGKSVWLAGYYSDTELLKNQLKRVDKGSLIIMHQGIRGSNSGEYFQDKTALTKEDLAGFRVISGHYHARQSFDLPDGGKFDYIGNPYTLNFGEANDPIKGFQILYSDGGLEFVPTNLRRHVKIDINLETGECNRPELNIQPVDLVWVTVRGSSKQLINTSKQTLSTQLQLAQDFKLDLIPLDVIQKEQITINQSQPEALDNLIDSMSNLTTEEKVRLKSTWKMLACGD